MIFLLALFASLFQTAFTGVNERTFLAIKPDGVQRHLASEDLLKEHYTSLRERPFYSRLVKYMSSGPVVAMTNGDLSSSVHGVLMLPKGHHLLTRVWQGLDVVKTARSMIGETNPADSKPGTIRGDFCIEVGKNVIHGSDSVESAHREISLWFHAEELTCWEDSTEHWIYE